MTFLALCVQGSKLVSSTIHHEHWDWQLYDIYFVVSHLHYVLVGANLIPVFAAFYYWLPKWTYPCGLGWDLLNLTSTIGEFLLALGIATSIWNFFMSLRNGAIAGRNPWNADTLEWDVPSPPPPYGSVHIPVVVSRHPLWDDFDEEEDPGGKRILDQGRFTFATTALDSDIVAISQMPEDTVMPLLTSLAITLLFVAILLHWLWVALGAFVFTFVLAGVWLWPEPEKRLA